MDYVTCIPSAGDVAQRILRLQRQRDALRKQRDERLNNSLKVEKEIEECYERIGVKVQEISTSCCVPALMLGQCMEDVFDLMHELKCKKQSISPANIDETLSQVEVQLKVAYEIHDALEGLQQSL
jgi:hypothetical protein